MKEEKRVLIIHVVISCGGVRTGIYVHYMPLPWQWREVVIAGCFSASKLTSVLLLTPIPSGASYVTGSDGKWGVFSAMGIPRLTGCILCTPPQTQWG